MRFSGEEGDGGEEDDCTGAVLKRERAAEKPTFLEIWLGQG